MKKALLLVILVWSVLSSSSSFACNLCIELEKRGFSPVVINKAIAEHFGTNLKVATGLGRPFSSSSETTLFNLAVSKDGRVRPVTNTRQLRGLSFDGFINTHPAKIFIANGVDVVGIKTDATLSSLPTRKERLIRTIPLRQRIDARPPDVLARNIPEQPRELLGQPGGPIIETSLNDASTLLAPANQALQEQKETADKTERLAKRVGAKKKERNQKFLDAGVTTSAIVTGLAIPPPVGPLVAAGIILTRVGWGLFQDDPNDE